ncbi:MFS transporter [Pengzhenrongella sp.]|uniref:MFS transporter n=1 Tax=Pengzhenrongella sp. TaxID=2888820 RepID=UPI002F92067D
MSQSCTSATESDPATRTSPDGPGNARSETRRSSLFGFVVSAVTLVVLVSQAGAPSPLYPLYQAEWNLSPLLMTAVFAVYVLGILLALTTAGSLSDHVGRRPVVVVAALLAVVALLVFATATSVVGLLVARTIQGAGVGLASGALGAALIDFQPEDRPRLAATLNGALPPVALSIGALGSSALVQYGPDPTVTVFVVFGALTFIVAGLMFFLAERHEPRPGVLASLKPTVTIPIEARPVFAAVVGCLGASWAIGGLYLGLGPTIVRNLLHLDNALAGGLAIVAVTGTGALTGLAIQRRDALSAMVFGAVALIAGPVFTVLALVTGSVWGFYASSIIVGIGFGAAFQGGLRLVLAVAPPEGRAGLISSVYLVSYLAMGLPAIVAGLLVPIAGLRDVVFGYVAFVALLAATALILQLVLRRQRGVAELADSLESILS